MTGANSHTVIEIYGNNWDGNAGVGNLKRVPDGLQNVARLGSPSGGGYGNAKSYAMRYNIKVQAAYPILFFQLSSIMDVTHGNSENTNYKFSVTDAIGNIVFPQPCGGLQLTPRGTASNAQSNVMTIPSIAGLNNLPTIGSILYQPWQSVALDLSSYIGQTVTLTYEHSDCYTGHHGSYTYVVAAMRSTSDTFYFCKNTSQTIIKPYQPNFKSYLWNTGATSDSLIINNPIDGAVYQCTVSSYNTCDVTFTYVLKEISMVADFNHTNGSICNQLQFWDQSYTNIGAVEKWYWDFGDPDTGLSNTDNSMNPLHVFSKPGVYNVTLTVTDTFECSNTITKKIELPQPICKKSILAFKDISQTTQTRTWIIDGLLLNDTAQTVYHTFENSGNYDITLVVIGDNGCPDSLTQTFFVHDLPNASIQVLPYSNAAPITNPNFQFKGYEAEAIQYNWDFGYNGATAMGQLVSFTYPSEIATYNVLLNSYNEFGCHDSTIVTVQIMPPDFLLPNAFSPNADGHNDVFKILNVTNHQIKEFSIYNRFGQRVFLAHKYNEGWDGTFNGKPCELGNYQYLIKYSLPDNAKEHVWKGEVTLIR